jgi:hypothetical protein
MKMMIRISACVCLALLMFSASAHAAMNGSFEELKPGLGVKLRLEIEDGHVSGQFRLPDGKTFKLNGEYVGGSAQGLLEPSSGPDSYFFIEEISDGVLLQFIPQNKHKKPDLVKAQNYNLVRVGKQPVNAKPAELRSSVMEDVPVKVKDEKSFLLPRADPRR